MNKAKEPAQERVHTRHKRGESKRTSEELEPRQQPTRLTDCLMEATIATCTQEQATENRGKTDPPLPITCG